jgi:hypothetical protein
MLLSPISVSRQANEGMEDRASPQKDGKGVDDFNGIHYYLNTPLNHGSIDCPFRIPLANHAGIGPIPAWCPLGKRGSSV